MPADPIRAALAELVACKDLKEQHRDLRLQWMMSAEAEPELLALVKAMWQDYLRRQPLAWEAARCALAQGAETPSVPVAWWIRGTDTITLRADCAETWRTVDFDVVPLYVGSAAIVDEAASS